MSRILLFLLALVAFPAQALAEEIEGSWALRIGDANIFVFEIEQLEGGEWSGTWTRPESFASNGVVFGQMRGSERISSMAGLEFAGLVELSFEDPRPGAVPDIFRIQLIEENRAELVYVGTDFEPYPLVRVAPGTSIGPFDDSRIYDRDDAVTEADYAASDPAQAAGDAEGPRPEGQEEEEEPRISPDFLDDL